MHHNCDNYDTVALARDNKSSLIYIGHNNQLVPMQTDNLMIFIKTYSFCSSYHLRQSAAASMKYLPLCVLTVSVIYSIFPIASS